MSPKAVAKARIYTIVAAFLVLVVAAVGYVFGFSPLWTAASEATEAAEDQEIRNDSEQRQVNALRAQFEQIDDYRQLLEELRIQVPTTLEHQEFQRQLATIVDDHDVTVNRIEFGSSSRVDVTKGEAVLAGVPLESEASGNTSKTTNVASNDADDSSGGSEASAEEETEKKLRAELGKPQFTNFYTIPVTIEFQGKYSDTLRAIQALQKSDRRVFLITKIDGTSQMEGGRSSDDSAEFVAVLEGQLSVLLDPEAAKSQPDSENVETPKLPGTKLDRNPLTGS